MILTSEIVSSISSVNYIFINVLSCSVVSNSLRPPRTIAQQAPLPWGFSRQEYTEELYKKDLHDLDNHDGVITHLEPDILEYEVKWALGGITINKARGTDGIPAKLFQILKEDAMKVLHSVCQEIWKTQQWPQDWKRSVFIPIPKKGNAKEFSNYRTIALTR